MVEEKSMVGIQVNEIPMLLAYLMLLGGSMLVTGYLIGEVKKKVEEVMM